jgi:hypothetical protein
MSAEATRAVIDRHWRLANERDWRAFGELLHPELRYDVPQTREYIEGGVGYLDLFATWPGDWRARIRDLVCEEGKAVCVIDFLVGEEAMTGISLFEVEAGRIVKVTDWWPEPYEPPPRASEHMKRRPG